MFQNVILKFCIILFVHVNSNADFSSFNPKDTDSDGIVDSNDNCPTIYNPEQHDTDKDGKGDVCDETCEFLISEFTFDQLRPQLRSHKSLNNVKGLNTKFDLEKTENLKIEVILAPKLYSTKISKSFIFLKSNGLIIAKTRLKSIKSVGGSSHEVVQFLLPNMPKGEHTLEIVHVNRIEEIPITVQNLNVFTSCEYRIEQKD